MEQINKTNEQLHEELEQALNNLSEKLANLLHYGSYSFSYLNRDWDDKKLSSACIEVGENKLFLQATDAKYGRKEGTEVRVLLPGNPVNESMLEAWDKQIIDHDIEYHQRQLNALMKRKEALNS